MKNIARLFALAAAVGTLNCSAAESNITVSITRPTVIGFFPPASPKDIEEDDGGLSEGTAHVGFALEDLEKCLAPRKLTVRFEHTRSLSIVDKAKTYRLSFPTDSPHAVGIVLATPGREPVIVYATAGPSSLTELAPQAAWKYFAEPKCKRYEEPSANPSLNKDAPKDGAPVS